MHSQRTAHARAVFQPDPEFSGSGIGLIPGPSGPVPLDKGNRCSGNQVAFTLHSVFRLIVTHS